MRFLVLTLLLTVLSAKYSMADTSLFMKERLYSRSMLVQAKDLFTDADFKQLPPYELKKDGIISNNALSEWLKKNGIRNFVLIGSGIDVRIIQKMASQASVKAILDEKYPGLKVDIQEVSNQLPKNEFIVQSIREKSPGNFCLEAVVFQENIGVQTNFDLILSSIADHPVKMVEKNEQDSEIRSNNKSSRGFFLFKNGNTTADLIYRGNGLEIATRVRIIRVINVNTYLVENLSSGRIFQVNTGEGNHE